MEEIQKPGLTNQAQEGYPRDGDIYMGEEGAKLNEPIGNEQASEDEAAEEVRADAADQKAREKEEQEKKQNQSESEKRKAENQKAENKKQYETAEERDFAPKEERLRILSEKITDPKLIAIIGKIHDSLDTTQLISAEADDEFMKAQVSQVKKWVKEDKSVSEDQARLFTEYAATLFSKDSEGDREKMKEIMRLPEGSVERIAKVMELLKEKTPYSAPLESYLIREAAKNDKTLNYLIIRIIGQSLDAEKSHYSQSFYGGINVDTIKDILKTKGEKGEKGERGENTAENNYKRVLITAEAASKFHEMNLAIITGDLDSFVRGSEAIMPEQLQVMQNVKGVSQVMRLFDEEIFRLINRDGLINGENHDEMMGVKRDPKTKEIINWGKGTVEGRFRKMVKAGVVDGLDRDSDEWEIKWAFNVGKIMGNISLRTAEQISLMKAQAGDYKMASWPLEKASRLFNWLGLTGLRYGMGDVRGGVFLAKMTRDIFQKQREEMGYGECRIKNLGWTDIGDFELAGICGVNGIWQGWRSNIVLLNQAPTVGGKTIKEYLDGVGDKMRYRSKNGTLIDKNEFVKEKGSVGTKLDEELQVATAARLREVFLKNGELNTECFNNSLGIILKHSILASSGKDTNKDLREAKEEIRAAIWRNVAKNNPLAMLPFLQGTKFVKDTKLIDKSLDELKKLDKLDKIDIAGGAWDPKEGDTEEQKEAKKTIRCEFADKLSILHELRMKELRNGKYVSLKDVINSEKIKKGVELLPEEEIWLKNIEEKGMEISRDLSNIRFPNIPFMNDAVFENSNYSKAGENYYGRRAGGDLGSFHKIGEGFSKLILNPGGTKPEDAFKTIGELREAIEGPLGPEFAQDRTRQFLEAYLTFVSKGEFPGVDLNTGEMREGAALDIQKWFLRDNLLSGITSAMRQPTSIAQIISGPNAASFDEFGMQKLLDEALHEGLIRKPLYDENGIALYTDLYKKFRKKLNAGFLAIFLAYLRDVSKVVVMGAAVELGKQVASTK